MTYYRAVKNRIVDETGAQIAFVMPVNCSKKLAAEMAAFAAQQANVAERNKQLQKFKLETAKRVGDFPLDFHPNTFLEGKCAAGGPYRFGRLPSMGYALCWTAHGGDPRGYLFGERGLAIAAAIFGVAALDAYIKANPLTS